MRNDDRGKGNPTDSSRTDISVGRRGYIKLASIAAVSASATALGATASADENGYGTGEYGDGGYGGDDPIESSPEDPSVDHFVVTERSRPNRHAQIDVEWSVSDPDDSLASVSVTVYTRDWRPLDEEGTSVSGGEASGSELFTIRDGADQSYYVTIEVEDEYGNSYSRTKSVTA